MSPSTELAPRIDAATVERVMLHGDLSRLTPEQKISYYHAVCESVGLNPLTQPFQYLVLSGKEVLYARREATEQLRRLHDVSITITARELLEDCYIVTARATLPSGRCDENLGVVPVGTLKGEARANAMMKAETKAKRRVTLAICGLGMLDETEVESIPVAAPLPMGNYATVQAAPPAEAGPDAALPDGWVRLTRIDSSPTKNPKVTKYWVQLSTGEKVATINEWLAALARRCVDERTPVKVTTSATNWGQQLDKIETEPVPELPAPPADGDGPF